MGNPNFPKKVFKENPEFKLLWDEYLLCRTQSIQVFYKKLKDGKEQMIVFPWTTGFGILPYEGGLHDQSYLTARVFSGFLEGERRGQLRKMMR